MASVLDCNHNQDTIRCTSFNSLHCICNNPAAYEGQHHHKAQLIQFFGTVAFVLGHANQSQSTARERTAWKPQTGPG